MCYVLGKRSNKILGRGYSDGPYGQEMDPSSHFLCIYFRSLCQLWPRSHLAPVNLGGTSFLDGVAGPGLLLEETVEYYHANRFTDSKGGKIPGDNSLESWLALTHVAYLTKFKILGGYYGVEALLPVVRVDLDTDLGIRGIKPAWGI